jgi:hypothetical protein
MVSQSSLNGLVMAKRDGSDESDYPSPAEMQGWLEREIMDAAKALELRVRDATRFVTAYSRGEISAKEARRRGYQYDCRWGEALPGVWRSRELSDEEILTTIDESRIRQGLMTERAPNRRKAHTPERSR